jgi:hypothetical protein
MVKSSKRVKQQPAPAQRAPFSWGTFWTAVAAIAAVLAVIVAIVAWVTPRRFVEASVTVLDVERQQQLDDQNHTAFAINCLLSNSGTVAVAMVAAIPYAVALGLPDKPLAKDGSQSVNKRYVQIEPGKQESFQVFVYLDKNFINEGQQQQQPRPAELERFWRPGASINVKVVFEVAAADSTYWGATSPPQLVAFIDGAPKVAHAKATPVRLAPIAEPKIKNLFQ